MGEVLPLPSPGDVFADIRGEDRTMRVSYHADRGVLVVSLWVGGLCRGSFRLADTELDRLIFVLEAMSAAARDVAAAVGKPGVGGPGAGEPGPVGPGAVGPGADAPGAGDSGPGDSGLGGPGAGRPGAGEPEAGPGEAGTDRRLTQTMVIAPAESESRGEVTGAAGRGDPSPLPVPQVA